MRNFALCFLILDFFSPFYLLPFTFSSLPFPTSLVIASHVPSAVEGAARQSQPVLPGTAFTTIATDTPLRLASTPVVGAVGQPARVPESEPHLPRHCERSAAISTHHPPKCIHRTSHGIQTYLAPQFIGGFSFVYESRASSTLFSPLRSST